MWEAINKATGFEVMDTEYYEHITVYMLLHSIFIAVMIISKIYSFHSQNKQYFRLKWNLPTVFSSFPCHHSLPTPVYICLTFNSCSFDFISFVVFTFTFSFTTSTFILRTRHIRGKLTNKQKYIQKSAVQNIKTLIDITIKTCIHVHLRFTCVDFAERE